MGERKVQNFYISPDFDPTILPRVKRDWNKATEVRMMLPFSLRCNTCGEFLYVGKKFNSKKEYVKGEDYLGIKRWRFIIKCSVCAAEITFKTDPKNSDYECESGASRNFETWRDTLDEVEKAKIEREEEDKLDAMKSLENRTLDSKVEMDILDALDEIKAMNKRHEYVDTNAIINKYTSTPTLEEDVKKSEQDYEHEIESIVKSVQFKKNHIYGGKKLNQPLSDSDEDEEKDKPPHATTTISTTNTTISHNNSSSSGSSSDKIGITSIDGTNSSSSMGKIGQKTSTDFTINVKRKKRKIDSSSSTTTTTTSKTKVESTSTGGRTSSSSSTTTTSNPKISIATNVTNKNNEDSNSSNCSNITTHNADNKNTNNTLSSLLGDYGDDSD